MSSPRPDRRWVLLEPSGDVLIVRLLRKQILEPETIEAIGDHLLQLVDRGGHTRLLVDFSKVEKMATDMLTKLVTLHRKAEAAGGRLAICGLSSYFNDILDALNLSRLLHVYAKEAEALHSF